MSKKLAIKGHETRGNEVIEILEMLGGNDDGTWWGNDVRSAYFINDCTRKIDVCTVETDIVVFTLEKFLKEFPFKVGDKVVDCYGNTVTIKSMGWHDRFETMVYDFEETEDVFCAEDLELFKEESNMRDKEDKLFDSIIWHLRNSINNGKQDISGGDCERYFRELADKVKETITPTPDITAEVTDKNNCNIGCPDGYEFYDEKGNLIGTKVMMKPKKPKYPTTYEECCIAMYGSVANTYGNCLIKINDGYKGSIIQSFQRLIFYRDAYWKIYGEGMGLNAPWEPDWQKTEERKFCIIRRSDNVVTKWETKTNARFLAFPTEEMRDAFYENFKDLIEQCKELL